MVRRRCLHPVHPPSPDDPAVQKGTRGDNRHGADQGRIDSTSEGVDPRIMGSQPFGIGIWVGMG